MSEEFVGYNATPSPSVDEGTSEEIKRDVKVYECTVCKGAFVAQDVREGLFHVNQIERDEGECERCRMFYRFKAGLKKPKCFGEAYRMDSSVCQERCGAKKACFLEFVDRECWKAGVLRETETHRRYFDSTSVSFHTERVLRCAGRPVHLLDIGATVMESFPDLFTAYDKDRRGRKWMNRVRGALHGSPMCVCLGGQFYVWKPYWDLDVITPKWEPLLGSGCQYTPVALIVEQLRQENGGGNP